MRVFERDILLISDFCDRFGRWKPSSMLVAMQEMAGGHATALGVERARLLENGLIWILLRNELHISRYPHFLDTVKARTYPAKPRRLFYPRFYVFEDAQGERLAAASSYWALMDVKQQKMVSADWVNALIPDTQDLGRPVDYPAAAVLADGEEQQSVYVSQFTDLDFNGHVNNSRCADWVCNHLGGQTLQNRPLQTLITNYNREIRAGEPLTLSWRQQEADFSLRCLREGTALIDVSGKLMQPEDPAGAPSDTAAGLE